jgi:penicillin-binding protein 2
VLDAMVGRQYGPAPASAPSGAPYSVGGKTGTAQVFSLRGQRYIAGRCASACATTPGSSPFAPAENPKIALAVLVENGGFGAQSAAPIARQVIDYYLLGKTPDGPAKEDEVAHEEVEEEE